MGYSNNKISAPVSIYDVQRALGTNECDLGSLCIHNSVNRWARFKPVKTSYLSPITHAIINNLNFGLDTIHGNWSTFKQNLGAYIGLVYSSTQQASINGVVSQKGEWVDGVKIVKPQGGTNSPYRLTDFVSYENSNLGYYSRAQLLPHMPNYAQDFPNVGVIGSEINGLIDYSSGTACINIDSLPATQDLPTENSIYDAFNIPISISGKTHSDYNCISILELMKHELASRGYNRGVVLVDVSGFVDESFNAVGQIPWGQWKNSQDESTLFGEWVCCEYYASDDATPYYVLIPGFEYKVNFKYGGSQYTELSFAKDPAMGHIDANHSNYMYIGFRQLTNENLSPSNWDITVYIYKYINGVKSAITNMALSSFSTYTSGALWYYYYLNVDYGTQSFAGDKFEVEIRYKRHGTSESLRSYYLTNIILTV